MCITGKYNRGFFCDSIDPKYDPFDRLVRRSDLYNSDIKWRDYIPKMEFEDEL